MRKTEIIKAELAKKGIEKAKMAIKGNKRIPIILLNKKITNT